MKAPPKDTRSEADARTLILCAIIGAVGVVIGALLPPLIAHFLPPKLGLQDAHEEQIATTVTWEHGAFSSGNEAAAVLTNQHPDPKDVYAAISGGKDIHVWWKPGKSAYNYSYSYVPWDPKLIPLPDSITASPSATKQIPIGFGSIDGRTVFVFFNAKMQ